MCVYYEPALVVLVIAQQIHQGFKVSKQRQETNAQLIKRLAFYKSVFHEADSDSFIHSTNSSVSTMFQNMERG